jgi:hypothetical protein
LLDEHDEALAGQSLRLVGSTNLSIGGSDNEDSLALDYTVAHDADAGRTLSTLDSDQNGTLTTYAEGSSQYYRIESDAGTEYGTGEPCSARATSPRPGSWSETGPTSFAAG